MNENYIKALAEEFTGGATGVRFADNRWIAELLMKDGKNGREFLECLCTDLTDFYMQEVRPGVCYLGQLNLEPGEESVGIGTARYNADVQYAIQLTITGPYQSDEADRFYLALAKVQGSYIQEVRVKI